MTYRRSPRIPAAAAGFTLVVCLSVASAQQPIPAPGMRKPGPALTVRTESGDVRVEALRGKVVLLDFMTTVCPACRQASQGIQQVYAEAGVQGFYPIAVALNVESAAAARAYAQDLGLTFPVATASGTDVLTYLQHPPGQPFHVPTLVLLDREGRVCSVEVGWKGEAALRSSVLKLLFEVERPD
jgi:peroxiredoxin